MKGAWRVKKGFNFREISSNLFSFQFSDVGEKERVFKSGPWSFDRALLVLREPGMIQPSKMTFEESPFWIRLYDLPFSAMNRETAVMLGNRIGEVLDVDESTVRVCGKFIRLRVMLNITKPLRRGVMVNMG